MHLRSSSNVRSSRSTSETKAFQGELFQVLELHLEATLIQSPQNANDEEKVAYYILHGTVSKTFGQIALIPKLPPELSYPRDIIVHDVIDMSVPRRLAKYDKSGYKIFLAQMKTILFGDPGIRMTKQRCEEFFDNDDNFDLGTGCMEETLIWAVEKQGIPDARVAHA